ncbi:MAG: TonB-dependent receptor domain-containing protein [Parcubacteria group bacterium]
MKTWTRILFGATALTSIAFAAPALAAGLDDTVNFQIAPGSLDEALIAYGKQADLQVISASTAVRGKHTAGIEGATTPREALAMLLRDSGLSFVASGPNTVTVTADPQSGSAAGDGADGGTVAALVVTAQKKEENIQDVPIAISAFTEKALEEQKIEGGFDLVKAVPNVTFSKNNFSGYNFSIRGIGTKAVSVTTDPGVAVSFNSTTLIRNRLFEQEYFDIERVEVLRGPQGTLYGRNATAGVVNVISAKPNLHEFSGMLKGEVGNYNAKRLSATVNVPLVDDKLAIRLAGASTVRDGYGINLYNNKPADGRDLWSLRTTVSFKPTDAIRIDLIWERFNEDDNRSRTGKQMCTRDPGAAMIGSFDMTPYNDQARGIFSQGCLPGSLYNEAAFSTPNGMAIPFVSLLASGLGTIGTTFDNMSQTIKVIPADSDPYGRTMQSHDLRALYSQLEAVYRAKADLLELNFEVHPSDSLTFVSQTAYDKDKIYSTQDYNRYATLPVISDSSNVGFWRRVNGVLQWQQDYKDFSPGGFFCDPQLGCSNSIMGMDLSRAKSQQFSQEFRLQSDFKGPLNFSVGATYTSYKTVEDYYVFFNGITMAAIKGINAGAFGGNDPSKRTLYPDCNVSSPVYARYGIDVPDGIVCTPIETNPIGSLNDTGRNYFRSRNPYNLGSRGVFGELYWEFSSAAKLTAGLRYTDDRKKFTPIPSETLLSDPTRLSGYSDLYPPQILSWFAGLPVFGVPSGGEVYPALPVEKREWKEVTGRLGVDWNPELSFTDHTLVYAFYSRGYKGGGLNPPPVGLNYQAAEAAGIVYGGSAPREFRPEFVNAFELGTKNTLLGGALVLNATGFFYDYRDYQVSKIVDRTANNENFDAKVWGVELEGLFQPNAHLRLNGSIGYLDTALAKGSKSIDVMNRTAGHADWVVRKPVITLTSNCIVPVAVQEALLLKDESPIQKYPGSAAVACPGGGVIGDNIRGDGNIYDRSGYYGVTYDPADHPEAHYGAGFDTDVSGHELPNSPHWTVTLGAQYSFEFLDSWKATVRSDFYWQSQQWARIYALPIDKLHAWKNANVSLLIERPDDGLAFELYAKNVFNDTPITDTFINSDDTALTTNIFVLDPRLLGLSIKKQF